jgi:NitT/TauT family transport system substrate-binding protein
VRRLAGILAFVLLVVPLASRAQGERQVIRVGLSGSDAFAEGYYAQRLGLFKKAGLNVKLSRLTTGAAIATAVSSGALDIGISNPALLGKMASDGAPFTFLAGGGMYSTHSPITALCVLRSGPIRKPKDLLGKTIAVVTTGDLTQIGLSAWLDKNAIDPAKVHLIQIPFSEMNAALQNGLADSAVITEPWLSQALHGGNARAFAKLYDAVAPEFLIGIWFTSTQWYAKNQTAAHRFVEVIYEAGRWANAHPEQSAKLLSDFSKIDVKTIRAMQRAPYANGLDPSMLQPPLDLAFKYHMMDRAVSAVSLIAK